MPSKKAKVVDSWEDEDLSDEEPAPPPPKTAAPPASAEFHVLLGQPGQSGPPAASWTTADSAASELARRPEKTDAVARRLIAGALGVRMPKQTEEQKAYDRSLREAEQKRQEAKKKQEEEREKAKRAIWED